MTRLSIFWEGEDISDDVELVNGRALPGGWSQHEIHYADERIGWLESGYPSDFREGFTYTLTEE